uniref:Cullin family profile domain-containing protein n=1 Tax=Eutreptiella gymnastica TaxID=73025 RepID=A0A7S1JHI4_9EUGL|mmetsp:Transcript_98503/g.169714  ORF Transcript_98503/g.169714 Transcript_98503/m.169714 type:complete len:745 (+) Transcript_98503:3-2237(+)
MVVTGAPALGCPARPTDGPRAVEGPALLAGVGALIKALLERGDEAPAAALLRQATLAVQLQLGQAVHALVQATAQECALSQAPPPRASDSLGPVRGLCAAFATFQARAGRLAQALSPLQRHMCSGRCEGVAELCLRVWSEVLLRSKASGWGEAFQEAVAAASARSGPEHALRHTDVLRQVAATLRAVDAADPYTAAGLQSPLYRDLFEEPFVAASLGHFRSQASVLAASSVPDYLSTVSRALQQEAALLQDAAFDGGTWRRWEPLLLQVLIDDQRERLLGGAASLLRPAAGDRVHAGAIRQLYHFATHDPALTARMQAAILGALRQEAEALFAAADPGAGNSIIPALCQLQVDYTEISNCCPQFREALGQSFVSLLHQAPGREHLVINQLCRYIHEKAITGPDAADGAAEAAAAPVLALFGVLQSKDHFQAVHSLGLGRRLTVHGALAPVDRAVLEGLRRAMGAGYVQRLERMGRDIAASADLTAAWAKAQGIKAEVEVQFRVLTTVAWPQLQSDTDPPALPPPLKAPVDAFVEFYEKRHQGRRLSWRFLEGTGVLAARLGPGYELTVSTPQLLLLLCLDEGPASVEELQRRVNVGRPGLIAALGPLMGAQHWPRLLHSPGGHTDAAGLQGTDRVAIDDAFHPAARRVCFCPLQAEALADAAPGATSATSLSAGRAYQLEAAIVRVMKAERVIMLEELVLRVTNQVQGHFVPAPADVRRCIDRLVERGILAPHQADRERYHYVG